jgi:hypothetical protein
MKLSLAFIGALLAGLAAMPGRAEQYGIARIAAPVLNTPDFDAVFGGRDGRRLKTDRCGQVRELEFIALPGTLFRILAELHQGKQVVYRVETDDYPSPAGATLYLDSRFVETAGGDPPARARSLADRESILSHLREAVGSPYVWGGNRRRGIAELVGMFYRGAFSFRDEQQITLAGVDCTGLLYEASGGWTPRNSSALVSFGRGLPVAGKSAAELARLLEPLDLIVWNGHLIIVLDRETVIESRLECGRPGNGGVMVTRLRQRLEEIMETRRAADAWPQGSKSRDLFVVRRWYGN